jgi:hypothetical protein
LLFIARKLFILLPNLYESAFIAFDSLPFEPGINAQTGDDQKLAVGLAKYGSALLVRSGQRAGTVNVFDFFFG